MLSKLFLDPSAQFHHHRTAAGWMTFEPLLGTHSFRLRLDSIDLPDCIEHTAALTWKGLLNLYELPPRVRQTFRFNRLFFAAPVGRERIRHLDRRLKPRASLLQ
jgi:hypothetical protein